MPTFTETVTNNRMPNFRWAGAALLAVCLAPGLALAAEPAAAPPQTNTAAVASAIPVQDLAQKWGIEVSGVFLSAGGSMVDFRYKVLNPAKAAFLTKPDTKPNLVNQDSGAKLLVPDTPTIGQLRQTTRQPVIGKLYFILFANTRHHVKSGDKVTLTVGDFKVENLVVE